MKGEKPCYCLNPQVIEGICKYCDQPIDEKRLRARPTSGACISCKKTLTDEV